ncbi:MAG: twin-arginine translocation signal domain-containing protein, partial [bacterium]
MNTRRQFLGGLALTGGLAALSHRALAHLPEIQTR